MAAASDVETYAFSADISQLMSLIINAFYSNKEIFLRELISNASDAIDKIQYKSQTDTDALAGNSVMFINVSPDPEARAVIVEDSGVGMTREEMVSNLGTIARSGTKAFMEAVTAGVDMSMIGQFGVGFYSAYLVSERIRVVSKSNDGEQYIWESRAGGTFTVWKDESFEHGVLKRGTKIICYLKDDQGEFLDCGRLRDLILKHSAFVGYPIELYTEHRKEEPGPEGTEEKLVTISHSWERINKNKPVWMRPADDVTHEEYAELYKWLASDWEDHLAVKHVIQNSQVDFKALLYCPRSPPKDMFDMGKMAQRFSIRLYVRRVFIKEFNDLIPKWMGFIKGIVDSDDMPLNISREKLQENNILKHIKTGIQKSAFQMFHDLSTDKARYKIFYEAFSQCLKLGVYEDHANRPQLIPLLRYHTTKSGDDLVSLAEYVERMKPGQQHILYITGRNRRDAARSPYIESLRKEGFEVLYMYDPVDEYAVQFLKDFQGKELLSCMNAQASQLLGSSTRTEEDLRRELEPLRKRLQVAADASRQEPSLWFVFGSGMAQEVCARLVGSGESAQVELNPRHGLLKELAIRKAGPEDKDFAYIVHEAAAVKAEDLEDPQRTVASQRCHEMIERLSIGDKDTVDDEAVGREGANTTAAMDMRALSKTPSNGSGDTPLLSCGSVVRVVGQDRARRAIISVVDEDKKTVDVMYPLLRGGEDEEEGVPAKKIQKLMPFEVDVEARAAEEAKFKENLYATASTAKEEGNQLFKLKDYEAAHERYAAIVAAFCSRPVKQGDAVLVKATKGDCQELEVANVLSVDAEGNCELSTRDSEVSTSSLLPVFDQLLPLQTAAHMNRARCRQNLGLHAEASQDLTVVLALWAAAPRRMLEADPEMKEAEVKGLYTAHYLRAKSRLARGFTRQAGADIKAALAREPPAPMAKQLKQLKAEVQAAQEENRKVNGPVVKELAKMRIMLGGGMKIN
eukprot:TRINITY_DN3591_c0_g1_i1.p1 TRINITY_DN3591_c0_g1~~TRINITY_DN3591_c0_g1_i1.p1  ORF type:complete len:969 (-),score=202.03 TRINITY_DN3591_c0_g1_i1:373-3279(-)